MAQSIRSYTWSDLRLQQLHRSLARTSIPRRIIAFSAVKLLHGRPPVLKTTQASASEQDIVQTTLEDTSSLLNSQGDSSAQTSNAPNPRIFSLDNIPTWGKVILGSLFVLAIPFGGKMIQLRVMAERVDSVVEVVHTVAEAAEKVAGDLAEVLPEGDLKQTAIKLERIASFVDKHAEYADSIIDKVDDVVEELEIKLQPLNVEEKSVAEKVASSTRLK
ncbi:hypothetical protein HPP92_010906 [Vanilla planifolia]|uniref:Uncharacterized protein n=1 Tax=Vanilla planifolia TaxID=51239 RepID=A0A835RAD4_VANPL|nr:hypothetical protein HPP92_010906 [Vanilla planifolia]